MTAQTSSFSASLKPLQTFFEKHHAVLFLSAIALLLAAAVFLLYTAVINASSTTAVTNSIETMSEFDQTTIDKIKKLHASGDPSDQLVFPTPRANPFTE